MRVYYKSHSNDRWRDIDVKYIAQHDFMQRGFEVSFSPFGPSVTNYEEFINKVRIMADYNKATPEQGEVKNAINPAHYKQLLIIKDSHNNVTDTIQWLEHLQYKPFWRQNMRAFVQAVLDLCADKYLSRLGMKDEEKQEFQKALWYTKFATAIVLNDFNPVRVDDIERILSEKKSG